MRFKIHTSFYVSGLVEVELDPETLQARARICGTDDEKTRPAVAMGTLPIAENTSEPTHTDTMLAVRAALAALTKYWEEQLGADVEKVSTTSVPKLLQ